MIKEIAASGIKVIIANSSVSDLAPQYFNSHSIAVLKVPSKFELRRLCRTVNAIPLDRMEIPTSEEVGWVDVY
jgi:T-complex protein 1 subunit theta